MKTVNCSVLFLARNGIVQNLPISYVATEVSHWVNNEILLIVPSKEWDCQYLPIPYVLAEVSHGVNNKLRLIVPIEK